jgi:hypothetical protein
MRVIKSKWHQVERRYATDIDIDFLAQVYSDMSDKELGETMNRLESGKMTIDELMTDVVDAWFDIDWKWLDEDEWWADHKITYKVEG